MSSNSGKNPADTKAVQSQMADSKTQGQNSATDAPDSMKSTNGPDVVVAELPPRERLAEEQRKADLNERIGAKERDELQQKAHDEHFVDPAKQEEAFLLTQSGEDGKLTEPNSQTEAQSHNALTAIETARRNEPDFVDAATREGGVEKLVNQQENLTKLVGEPRDHELNDAERERVEQLRSRSDMRDISDPKNQVNEFAGTAKAAKQEMFDHRKEIAKADRALQKELKQIERGQKKEQADRLKENERLQAEADAEVDAERKARETPDE